ncbi:MAG: ATP/GTP-binding protein [Chloroflexota bacterium]|nr:ATP/GTP-binding protein [Chloroflexota bacterium]
MVNLYKVVVTGPFNVGKTEFIRTISDIPIVSTERRITDQFASTKEETTVAMDYGHVRLNDDLLHMYGTPGQPRFDFMWDILSKEMHAFILLVDSCDPGSFMQAKRLIRIFRRKSRVPYLVVANKQDMYNALSAEEISKRLGLDEQTPVIPCVATDKPSVQNVLKELHSLMQ